MVREFFIIAACSASIYSCTHIRQSELYRTILFVKGEQDNGTDRKDENQNFLGQSHPTASQEEA
jgi:hypothetical protein